MTRNLGPWQRALLDRLLSGSLGGPLARFAHRRIGAAPSTRAAYDGLRDVERAACGARELSDAQLSFLEGAVLARVASPAAGRARAASLGVLVAAALALVVVVAQRDDELVARGAGGSLPLGLKVSCLDEGGGAKVSGDTVLGAARAAAPLRCPRDAVLAFSVTNLTREDAHVFLVGVRDDGELLWFAPFAAGGASVRVEGDVERRVLDVAATTREMDLGKRTALFALFHDEPLDARTIERALEGARGRGLALYGLERLPLDVAAQSRAELVVTQAPTR